MVARLLTGLFLYCFEIIKRNKGGFYCHENNVKVKVAVKFIDNQTKETQVSQFELVLHKDNNWKIVG